MLEKVYIVAIQLIKRIAIGFASLKALFSSRMHCLKAYSQWGIQDSSDMKREWEWKSSPPLNPYIHCNCMVAHCTSCLCLPQRSVFVWKMASVMVYHCQDLLINLHKSKTEHLKTWWKKPIITAYSYFSNTHSTYQTELMDCSCLLQHCSVLILWCCGTYMQ